MNLSEIRCENVEWFHLARVTPMVGSCEQQGNEYLGSV
jgi:hypothetical protein